MDIFPFTPGDLPDLIEMHRSNNLELGNYLPEIGFIVRDNQNKPIAAGFLRRVEGGLAQLDTYVTNAKAFAIDRHNAIDLLTQTLLNTAKNLNISGLIIITQIESIANRALKLGFTLNPHVVLGLKLD